MELFLFFGTCITEPSSIYTNGHLHCIIVSNLSKESVKISIYLIQMAAIESLFIRFDFSPTRSKF